MKDFYEDRFPNQEALDTLTWKPLRLLSFYRVILAGLLTILFFSLADSTTLGIQNSTIYKLTAISYLLFVPACASLATSYKQSSRYWWI
jgi:two-component system sensor histidine kinase PilS (NtrC family)